MNCKPGDLALCVAGCFAGYECEVIIEGPILTRISTGEESPGWLVGFKGDMPWPDVSNPLDMSEGWYPDDWLRPLKQNGGGESCLLPSLLKPAIRVVLET